MKGYINADVILKDNINKKSKSQVLRNPRSSEQKKQEANKKQIEVNEVDI